MTRLRSLPVAALVLLTFFFAASALAQTAGGVYTQQYDVNRSGRNSYESILTPANVNSNQFGKLFSFTVDGQIYAQPLLVPAVNIPGQGVHNVVYVATQLDTVYAIDANTGQQLWSVNFTDPANGIGPVPCGTDGKSNISCSIYPYYGISATPVIDPTTNIMYLIARTYNNNTSTGYQNLHALDITTGNEMFGGPVEIQGSVQGSGEGSQGGTIHFNPLADIQRSGLLLLYNSVTKVKTIYVGWAGAAHGWIMGYNATTLEQTAIFNPTPNAVRGGVWQSGNGMASDNNNYIYVATGDGLFDANTGGTDYGDSLLKLDGNLDVIDYFTPMDQSCRYQTDFDLASSGPTVLPTQPGQYPDEIVTSGKGGSPCDTSGYAPIYLVDRDNMGKYNANADNIIQEINGAPAGYWSSPAQWIAGTQEAIYYGGVTAEGGKGDYMKEYTLTNGLLSSAPASQSSNLFPVGATPSTSGYGVKNGIVWAALRQESLGTSPGQLPAILYAYDATNLKTTLYSSAQNATRDQGGCANKMQVPVVANGKVYVGTQNEVDVFGLLASATMRPAVSLSNPCFTYAKQSVGTTSPAKSVVLTNSGRTTLNLGTFSIRGFNATDFDLSSNNCPAALAPKASCTIEITFTPSATGVRVGQVMIPDNAPGSPHNVALTGVGD